MKTFTTNPRTHELKVTVSLTDICPVGTSDWGEECYQATTDAGQLIWFTESNISINPNHIILYDEAETQAAIERMVKKQNKE